MFARVSKIPPSKEIQRHAFLSFKFGTGGVHVMSGNLLQCAYIIDQNNNIQ